MALVHAVGTALPPCPPSVLLTYPTVGEVARRIVSEAADDYSALNGVRPDAMLVRPGKAGAVLSGLSADAELVVVGHRDLGALRRVVTASTAVSVAAHARCPLVVVPRRRAPDDTPASTWVTVGVHEQQAPPQVLEAAKPFLAASEVAHVDVRRCTTGRPRC